MTRRPAPVFIVGSARSGTTLVYHTLLSTGTYAVYRGEPAIFDLVQPRYGDLRHPSARARLLREWPRSHLARASGLDSTAACKRALEEVRSNGDFLRAVMETVAQRQGVSRWAVWGPDNLLLMPWIKREMPDARFVHIVRDGRDVALSMGTEGWVRPIPGLRASPYVMAALHWQWKLRRGRVDADRLGADYMELRFESLVRHREDALRTLATFLGHDIDPEVVDAAAVGTVRDRNSTFAADRSDPVGRWRHRFSTAQVLELECAVGSTLDAFGYERSTKAETPRFSVRWPLYTSWFEVKHLARTHTACGRYVDPGRLRLASPPAVLVGEGAGGTSRRTDA